MEGAMELNAIPMLIGGLGTTELVLILLVVLILFGAGKLPEVGKALGSGIRNFKDGIKREEDEIKEIDVTPGVEDVLEVRSNSDQGDA